MRSWWRWSKWWWLLVLVMTEGRCHRRKKMMGRGPDGGCGTDERPCRPISRVPATQHENELPTTTSKEPKPASLDVDFFSQARKALSERSPFEVPEDGAGSTANALGGLSVCTLPSGLASLLKQSDSRKRHKRSHSAADKKSSRGSERSKGGSIWIETEEYFRDLALQDIDALFEVSSSSLRSVAASKYFLIPHIGNEKVETGVSEENLNVVDNMNVDSELGHVNGNEIVAKEEAKREAEQFVGIDNVGPRADVGGAECLVKEEEKVSTESESPSSLEWLLGCRNRVMLTSERPNKKRKLLGSDAGLEKILVGHPCEGNSSLCDFCCKGEMGNDSNRLIVCSSCKVAVHCKCYGVQGSVEESWLCSWCKQKADAVDLPKQACVLCPKQGGALKHVGEESGESHGQFAHLFCSQWMPEVYVDDIRKMEPIMNMGGIRETRRKLVCNVCKVKCGACVRCSHGTCRTAFHPICAREGRQRMEVWGKYGSNDVELRAFCAKHTEVPDGRNTYQLRDSVASVRSDSSVANHKQRIEQNGDTIAVHVEAGDSDSDHSGDSGSQEIGLSGLKDGEQFINAGTMERSDIDEAKPSESLNVILIMKKLIDGGKVNVKDVASEIGIPADSLISTLAEDSLVSDLQCKIFKWLRNHAYMGTSRTNMKVKLKFSLLSKNRMGTANHCDGVTVSESDITDPVAVKSVPPRRRTKSNIRILRDGKVICSEEILSGNGTVSNELKVDKVISEEPEKSSEVSIPDMSEKGSINTNEFQDLAASSPKDEGHMHPSVELSEKVEHVDTATPEQYNSRNVEQGNHVYPVVDMVLPDLIKTEAFSRFYVHPSVYKKLSELQDVVLLKNSICGSEGSTEGEGPCLVAPSSASVCCNHQNNHSNCNDMDNESDLDKSQQLMKAQELGVFDLSPADEVEGELIYFQHRLLDNAVSRKHYTDNLICKVARTLPQEINASRGQRWDNVLVNQYLWQLREAKKQGRKERRHKEAQAVLAAATAAAASSSRNSSFRKDTFDESANLEGYNAANGRAGISSQLLPRPKETLSKVAVARVSSEKYSDFVHSISDFSKEHPRSCDICRRSETMLNPILVCSSCKVAVHLDCYRSVKETTGPWFCELCEELSSSKYSGGPSVNVWDKPYFVAECGLCGDTTGAFRKSADGQWVHAFCAEWVFEPMFRRGQINPVEGMETVSKGGDVCCVCRRKHGVCLKCSYGHCQTTFHPSCARSAGFYMTVKTLGGKLQHKAYCEKHSLEQRAKVETQKHGIEELKTMKQIRVELERLRLLCERIVRREKIKRDLVLCSHSILACKRDHGARSALVHSPFLHPDVSSESATTSLKGNTDGCKSYSDAIQRSDDVTVDSTLSVKHRVKVTMSMDTDQKTDDSSTSQNLFMQKPMQKVPFGRKQIPQRAYLGSHNLPDDGDWSFKSKKRIETFEKELVMTSDQASMKNQQLPKGYFYIPVDCLPKEKQINQDASSGKPVKHDG